MQSGILFIMTMLLYLCIHPFIFRTTPHWNGSLLDTVDTVLNLAQSLEFKGQRTLVKLVTQVYETGVKLSQQAMTELEKQLQRLPRLEKWFVEIPVSTA